MKIQKSINKASQVRAPLPGSVVDVFVKEGDSVAKGDKLLIYEAMKMENTVLSDKDGTILSVKIHRGDTFLQDDVLVEME